MLAPRKKLWSTPPSAVDIALDFADLDADDVVYDVGCGDGRVLIRMAAASSEPLASDADAATSSSVESYSARDERRGERRASSPRQRRNQSPTNAAAAEPEAENLRRRHPCRRFVGIEISSDRAAEARENVVRAREAGRISPRVSVDIVCANALEVDYDEATVLFLYLVPRGLRLMKDIVWPPEEGGGGGGCMQGHRQSLSASPRPRGAEMAATATSGRTRPRRIITYMAPFENTPCVRKERCEVEHQDGAAWPVYLYHAT